MLETLLSRLFDLQSHSTAQRQTVDEFAASVKRQAVILGIRAMLVPEARRDANEKIDLVGSISAGSNYSDC